VFSGSVLIAAHAKFHSAITRATPPCVTSSQKRGLQMPVARAARRMARRWLVGVGVCVLQADPPAIPEIGQGGFVSSLPPLTLGRTRLKRRSFMTESISNKPKHHSVHKQQTAHANSSTTAIPRGLVRCAVCHEYRGAVRNDDLPPARQREEAVVAVLCICDGIPCRKCRKERIHRPISNYWDEARGALIHCPWFSGQAPCKRCRAEQQPRIA
jgi:hypothetical protein